MTIQRTLPWPPSVNAMWRAIPRGKCCTSILSKKGRDYRESALIAIAAHNLTLRQLDGRLQVSLDLHPPTLRKYDADNYCKAIFDSLTHGGVWLDDEQVDSLHVLKCPKDADNPRVVVTITELEKN